MFYYFVFGLFATATFPMIRFICVKAFFVFSNLYFLSYFDTSSTKHATWRKNYSHSLFT